jgi:hypothetical protein
MRRHQVNARGGLCQASASLGSWGRHGNGLLGLPANPPPPTPALLPCCRPSLSQCARRSWWRHSGSRRRSAANSRSASGGCGRCAVGWGERTWQRGANAGHEANRASASAAQLALPNTPLAPRSASAGSASASCVPRWPPARLRGATSTASSGTCLQRCRTRVRAGRGGGTHPLAPRCPTKQRHDRAVLPCPQASLSTPCSARWRRSSCRGCRPRRCARWARRAPRALWRRRSWPTRCCCANSGEPPRWRPRTRRLPQPRPQCARRPRRRGRRRRPRWTRSGAARPSS